MTLCLAQTLIAGCERVACQPDDDGHDWHEARLGLAAHVTWRTHAPAEITRTEKSA